MQTKRIQWVILTLIFALPIGFSLAKAIPEIITALEITNASKYYGEQARPRLEAWQTLVAANQNKSNREKLEIVNNFFNRVNYRTDLQHWRREDYWASPIEFLATNAGDCEDYSIAKYFTLLALGIPESKLYITYVKALRLNEAHMVLTYFETPTTIPLVLDNINRLILPATQRSDLAPVYSFNGGGLWLARQRGNGVAVPGGTRKLKSWNELQRRLNSFK